MILYLSIVFVACTVSTATGAMMADAWGEAITPTGLYQQKHVQTAAMKKVFSQARRLEDNDEDEQEEEEFEFLQSYSMKFISCKAGEKMKNERGEYEYNSVVFRLCPTDTCEQEEERGCSEYYSDYVVGLNTFTEAYLEEMFEDRRRLDEDFNMRDFSECRQVEIDNNDNDRRRLDENNEYVYYVGPACTEDGKDIKFDLFADYTCQYEPEDGVNYYDLTGTELPYNDGGLASSYCMSCLDYNEDEGGYETKEMCERIYEDAAKCETFMEYYSNYYGRDESSCEYIESLMPIQETSGSSAGKIFLWIFIFIGVVGGAYYFAMQRKKMNDNRSTGLLS